MKRFQGVSCLVGLIALVGAVSQASAANGSSKVCDRNDGWIIWQVAASRTQSCDAVIEVASGAWLRCADEVMRLDFAGLDATLATCRYARFACTMTTGFEDGGWQSVRCSKGSSHWLRFRLSNNQSMVDVPEVTTCLTASGIGGAQRIRVRVAFLRQPIQVDSCALNGKRVAFRASAPSSWRVSAVLRRGVKRVHIPLERRGRERLGASTVTNAGSWRLEVRVLPPDGDQFMTLQRALSVAA